MKQTKAINRTRKKKKRAFVSEQSKLRMPTAAHGHVSEQIGLIALASFVILLVISYLTHGSSAAIIGAFGLIILLLTIIGVFQVILGLGEPNKDQSASKRRLVINIAVLIILLAIFFSGLRSL